MDDWSQVRGLVPVGLVAAVMVPVSLESTGAIITF